MNKRIWFLDIIRVIAFSLIIFYHMTVQLALDGICDMNNITPLFLNKNLHIATLGVSLFFMISGAGLMLESSQTFHLKEYLEKRFIRIFIPFYIVYIGVLCIKLVCCDLNDIFLPGVPLYRVVYTVFAVDTYLSTCGILTFTLGIGEWFLGCIVIIYILFPILRMCIKKYPIFTFGVATIYYLLIVYFYFFELPPIHMNFLTKIYNFVLGMFIIQYWGKIKKRTLIVTLPLIGIFIWSPIYIPVSDELKTTILAVAVFLAVMQIEKFVSKSSITQKGLSAFRYVHYELFLVHHVIIYALTDFMCEKIVSIKGVLFLYVCEIIFMLLAAYFVKYLEKVLNMLTANKSIKKT